MLHYTTLYNTALYEKPRTLLSQVFNKINDIGFCCFKSTSSLLSAIHTPVTLQQLFQILITISAHTHYTYTPTQDINVAQSRRYGGLVFLRSPRVPITHRQRIVIKHVSQKSACCTFSKMKTFLLSTSLKIEKSCDEKFSKNYFILQTKDFSKYSSKKKLRFESQKIF